FLGHVRVVEERGPLVRVAEQDGDRTLLFWVRRSDIEQRVLRDIELRTGLDAAPSPTGHAVFLPAGTHVTIETVNGDWRVVNGFEGPFSYQGWMRADDVSDIYTPTPDQDPLREPEFLPGGYEEVPEPTLRLGYRAVVRSRPSPDAPVLA